jgi:hypothetical protein
MLSIVFALLLSSAAASHLSDAESCKVCQRLVQAVRAGPNGFKAGPMLARVSIDATMACSSLQRSLRGRDFPLCGDVIEFATSLYANMTEPAVTVCKSLGYCRNVPDHMVSSGACGGPCSSASQCGPGCYCSGYGTCMDACSPGCQGETQFCPHGCGCGDYGFCDPA